MPDVAGRTPERAQRAQPASCVCFLDSGAAATRAAALDDARARSATSSCAPIPTVMVMAGKPEPRDTFVLKRGAYDNPGEKVTPGVPAVLPPLPAEWPNNRLGLARWLVDRGNPLTARVAVNRFWQIVLRHGPGEDGGGFRLAGRMAVHPELLDWLATEFMRERLGREGACRRPS